MDLISEHLTSPRHIVSSTAKCRKRRYHQKIRRHLCDSQRWDSGKQQTFVKVDPLLTPRSKVYGYVIYQQRITMIRRRDPGHYGEELPLDIWTLAARAGTTSRSKQYLMNLQVFMIYSALSTPDGGRTS